MHDECWRQRRGACSWPALVLCAAVPATALPARADAKDIPDSRRSAALVPDPLPPHRRGASAGGRARGQGVAAVLHGYSHGRARGPGPLSGRAADRIRALALLGRRARGEGQRGRSPEAPRASPLRFSDCMNDRSGSWKTAFGLTSLPAAVFVNEEGYVVRRQYGFRVEDGPEITRDIERLIGAGKLAGKAAHDFKLREVGTDAERTLADLVDRDYTIFLSLRSDCTSCREELEELKLFRDRNKEQVSLVVVYHDQVEESPVAVGAEGAWGSSRPRVVGPGAELRGAVFRQRRPVCARDRPGRPGRPGARRVFPENRRGDHRRTGPARRRSAGRLDGRRGLRGVSPHQTGGAGFSRRRQGRHGGALPRAGHRDEPGVSSRCSRCSPTPTLRDRQAARGLYRATSRYPLLRPARIRRRIGRRSTRRHQASWHGCAVQRQLTAREPRRSPRRMCSCT